MEMIFSSQTYFFIYLFFLKKGEIRKQNIFKMGGGINNILLWLKKKYSFEVIAVNLKKLLPQLIQK